MSEVLGHKEIAITLDRYSHALPTMPTEAMARLDAVLGRSESDGPAPAAARASASELWLDGDSAAWASPVTNRDKGSPESRRGNEEARSELGSGQKWRGWYRIPDSQ